MWNLITPMTDSLFIPWNAALKYLPCHLEFIGFSPLLFLKLLMLHTFKWSDCSSGKFASEHRWYPSNGIIYAKWSSQVSSHSLCLKWSFHWFALGTTFKCLVMKKLVVYRFLCLFTMSECSLVYHVLGMSLMVVNQVSCIAIWLYTHWTLQQLAWSPAKHGTIFFLAFSTHW